MFNCMRQECQNLHSMKVPLLMSVRTLTINIPAKNKSEHKRRDADSTYIHQYLEVNVSQWLLGKVFFALKQSLAEIEIGSLQQCILTKTQMKLHVDCLWLHGNYVVPAAASSFIGMFPRIVAHKLSESWSNKRCWMMRQNILTDVEILLWYKLAIGKDTDL